MKLALFGSPVRHSLSPVMHRAALDAADIEGDYVARDVDGNGFSSGVSDIRSGDLTGANVTMPHKALAFSMCDNRSPEAERAGAVNTLRMSGSRLVGENTDVVGIRTAWDRAGLPESGSVIIFGAGSAAAAALIALEGRDLIVVARRREQAQALIMRTGVSADVGHYGRPPHAGVLLNATSIGMAGEHIPDDLLEPATGLFDMAYGNLTTPAVARMRRSGLPVAAGLDMLVGQAVASFAIWTGMTVDPAVMRVAAEEELARRAA